MQATPLFLGACAIASFAGAIGGASINTQPIQRASIGSAEIRRSAIAFDPADSGQYTAAMPNHYAMTTPNGRVEIGELADRGLYSQRRYGWREAAFERMAEPAVAEPLPAAEPEIPEPAIAPEAVPALALAEPAALATPAAGGGGARTIDVGIALAARR